MICQLYDSWYRENCINMLSDQNTAMKWHLSLMNACIIVPWCKIKVLKHLKLCKDAYILQESFAMTGKSYPPPNRNYLQPLYLSLTLYACAQRALVWKANRAVGFLTCPLTWAYNSVIWKRENNELIDWMIFEDYYELSIFHQTNIILF